MSFGTFSGSILGILLQRGSRNGSGRIPEIFARNPFGKLLGKRSRKRFPNLSGISSDSWESFKNPACFDRQWIGSGACFDFVSCTRLTSVEKQSSYGEGHEWVSAR